MRQILALLLLVSPLAIAPAIAQTEIHRCIGADGNAVFTDQQCVALGATPLAHAAQSAETDASLPKLAVLCAVDMAALKQAVIDAFANRDANRLAGLMLWGGYGHRAAVADIRALQISMREPLLDFGPSQQSDAGYLPTDDIYTREFYPFDATAPTTPPPLPAAPAPAPDTTLVLHTGASDGRGQPHEIRFNVVRRSGCLWLRNAY